MGDAREDGLIEMVVESVRVHMLSSQHVVILRQVDRERYLLIWVGSWEADAIARKLQGVSPARPLTHDTFVATIEALGADLRRVVITSLADETFHARMELVVDSRPVEVDSRPSDALALAVRSGVRIFVAPDVLERAGVEPDGSTGEDLETTDDAVGDEGLEVFRDFVNSLDTDLGEERREGPGPGNG